MTKHKNVALDELRILAALMVLAVHTGTLSGGGRQCSPAVWPRRAVRAGLPAVLCIFADVAAQ